jgi:transcriptional/translational regulatory protein YebC/TACO1
MHRIKPLDEVLQLLNELTAELKQHRSEIVNDEVLAVQRETRIKIRKLVAALDELFPNMQAIPQSQQS